MGKVHAPLPAKLFIGMLSRDIALFELCAERFSRTYGPVDLRSEILPWDHSDYYREEMGADLRRAFLFFERLIDPGNLAAIKQYSIQLEQELSCSSTTGSHRRINLDPGYLTEAKVVLATTKDFPHRVYIGGNMYAESTLHFSKSRGTYIPVEHTYPDFRAQYSLDLFKKAREILRMSLRSN